MAYPSYMHYIQQVMAMGMYNVPMNVPAYPLMPHFLPVQNVQTPTVPWSQNVIIEIESDEDDDDDVDERTLFCANLHRNVSDELLYELFLQAGPIQKVHIPKDNNGKSRLFGFVTYKHRSCPQYAQRLFHGLTLFGRTVDIKFQGKCNFNERN